MRDRFAKPITDWEEKHPNDPDIKKFLDEMVNLAIAETMVNNLGWEDHGCSVYYESKPLIDPVTREITMKVPKEKAAWMLGLVALS